MEDAEQDLTRAELEDDEDLALGHAYRRALMEKAGAVELDDGVWYIEKAPDDRGHYWVV